MTYLFNRLGAFWETRCRHWVASLWERLLDAFLITVMIIVCVLALLHMLFMNRDRR